MDSEDELPPGIPSATGLPIYWLRASSSSLVSQKGGQIRVRLDAAPDAGQGIEKPDSPA